MVSKSSPQATEVHAYGLNLQHLRLRQTVKLASENLKLTLYTYLYSSAKLLLNLIIYPINITI